MGPSISGATFHKDPNSTSAWNGLIYGAKKWIMYPPEVTPPGIYASEDGWEVTTPVSSIEWFHNFYAHKVTPFFPSFSFFLLRPSLSLLLLFLLFFPTFRLEQRVE